MVRQFPKSQQTYHYATTSPKNTKSIEIHNFYEIYKIQTAMAVINITN